MSLAKASLWTAVSTLVKIGAGLLVVKLLAVSFGPAPIFTSVLTAVHREALASDISGEII